LRGGSGREEEEGAGASSGTGENVVLRLAPRLGVSGGELRPRLGVGDEEPRERAVGGSSCDGDAGSPSCGGMG